MKSSVVIDTGPIVALLNSRDQYHEWTLERMKRIKAPFFTCEAVITETIFLLNGNKEATSRLVGFLTQGTIRITQSLALEPELERVCDILNKYGDLPASLADACLVRMSENHPRRKVFTLDNHFRIYRRNDGAPLPLIIPH